MKSIFTLLTISIIFNLSAQEPKGDRILAWQIDMAENLNYDSAFAYGVDACMESIHLSSTWVDIDTNAGNFDNDYITGILDAINWYYPTMGVKIEYQLAPLNTNVNTMPADLVGLAMDDPLVISRFKQTLDTVFSHLDVVEFSALNIGNEHDIYMGTDAAQYEEFKVFLDSVVPYAKNLYFDLHGEELIVGTTFTMEGILDPVKSSLCQDVNDGLDIVTVTYYPQSTTGGTGDESYAAIKADFEELIALYPDPTQEIYFSEIGWASSTYLGSSELIQANFFSNLFTVWDEHAEKIPYITIFKSTDWSSAAVDELADYYGLSDSTFTEFLRTLGLREWDGDGTNKLAYDRILCELHVRDWCGTTCASLGVENQELEITLYPNPSNGIFQYSGINVETVQVFNSIGQSTLIETDNNTIDLSNFTDGIYLIHFVDQQGNSIVKKVQKI